VDATILVIAYRMAPTIGEAVRSALAQTVPSEIIVSDDSSDDGTLEAAEEAIANRADFHRVRVRSTARNVGLCAHLVELAAEARGEVLVCLSGDDVSYPQRTKSLLDAFAAYPKAEVIGSAVDEIDLSGKPLRTRVRALPERVDQRWFLTRGKMTTVLGASMALRRRLIADLPPLVGSIEDNMLSLRAALVGECRCLQQSLLGYRRHPGNFAKWVFDRASTDYVGFERRNRRVIELYRDVAADQERCVAARPDLDEERRRLAREIAAMYRLEADMREAILDLPKRDWLPLLAKGWSHPGLRRKAFERTLKFFVPRGTRFGRR
jgi:hypothetical protein